jgi:hypothetical protein
MDAETKKRAEDILNSSFDQFDGADGFALITYRLMNDREYDAGGVPAFGFRLSGFMPVGDDESKQMILALADYLIDSVSAGGLPFRPRKETLN